MQSNCWEWTVMALKFMNKMTMGRVHMWLSVDKTQMNLWRCPPLKICLACQERCHFLPGRWDKQIWGAPSTPGTPDSFPSARVLCCQSLFGRDLWNWANVLRHLLQPARFQIDLVEEMAAGLRQGENLPGRPAERAHTPQSRAMGRESPWSN